MINNIYDLFDDSDIEFYYSHNTCSRRVDIELRKQGEVISYSFYYEQMTREYQDSICMQLIYLAGKLDERVSKHESKQP